MKKKQLNLDLSQPVRQRCGLSVRNVELIYGETNQEKCFPIHYECQKKDGGWGEPRLTCRLTGETSIFEENLCDWDLVNHPDGVLISTEPKPHPMSADKELAACPYCHKPPISKDHLRDVEDVTVQLWETGCTGDTHAIVFAGDYKLITDARWNDFWAA